MKILHISINNNKLVAIDDKRVYVFIILTQNFNNTLLIEDLKKSFKEHTYINKVEEHLKNLGYVIELDEMYSIKLIDERSGTLFKSKSDIIKILFNESFMKNSDMWNFTGWCCEEAKKIINTKDELTILNPIDDDIINSYIKKVYDGFYKNHENVANSKELEEIKIYHKKESELLQSFQNRGLFIKVSGDYYDKWSAFGTLLAGYFQESHKSLISLYEFKENKFKEDKYSYILKKLLTYF